MKHPLILALAAITLAGCEQQQPTEASAVPAPSRSSVNSRSINSNSSVKMTSSVTIPVSTALFVQCANTGSGQLGLNEQVGIRGPLVVSSRLNMSTTGSGDALIHLQSQGLAGLGFTTGTKFVTTGNTEFRTSFTSLPVSGSTIASFTLIGQGGNSFLVNATLNFTVDASGQLTATIDNPSVVCGK